MRCVESLLHSQLMRCDRLASGALSIVPLPRLACLGLASARCSLAAASEPDPCSPSVCSQQTSTTFLQHLKASSVSFLQASRLTAFCSFLSLSPLSTINSASKCAQGNLLEAAHLHERHSFFALAFNAVVETSPEVIRSFNFIMCCPAPE